MIELDHIFQPKTPPIKFNYNSKYFGVPIVIDNGSYQFRAGFATDDKPYLQFKNVIGKSKLKKDGILVGDYIEDYSGQLRYAFDRNVVVNYDVQESIFDYAFDQLGVQSLSEHDVVLNEPLCNPNICRQQMSELLFEVYGTPSLSYYVDGLASYMYNNPEYLESFASDTVLIVSFGYQTIHMLPLINGRLESKLCRKINVGGSQLDSLMMRLLQLKYSCHANLIDLRIGEHLIRTLGYVPLDYKNELYAWKNPDYVAQHSIKIQLPFKKSERLLTQEQLEEKKRLQSVRGKEIYNRRNQEKLVTARESLTNLKDLLTGNKDNTKVTLKSFGFENHDEVMDEMKNLESTIQNLENKINGIETKPHVVPIDDKDKYDLLDISDDELDEEEMKLKQKQIMMKAAAMRREQIRLMKELQRQKILTAVSKLEETRHDDFPLWVMNLRHRRLSLIDSRMKKRNSATLNTAFNGPNVGIDERRQQKARKIRKLAAELNEEFNTKPSKKSIKESGNQMDELRLQEEWSDDESDTEQKQLTQLEILLSQYDPEFTKDSNAVLKINLEEYYRLQLTTEPMRVPEVMFRPYMIGYEDAGLLEMLQGLVDGDYLLHLSADQRTVLQDGGQKQMAENVFLTGSVARLPGLQDRLFYELRQILPISSPDPIIQLADDPTLDAWKGACRLVKHTQFDSMQITKEMYEEMGHDYIQEHPISNFFYSPLTDFEEIC